MARKPTPVEPVEPVDTLTIEFDERPEKVVTRQSPVSLNALYALDDVRDRANWAKRETLQALFAAFAPYLISWDFAPPATAEGMADIDVNVAVTIIDTWRREVRNVDRPLGRRSSAGEPSPAP